MTTNFSVSFSAFDSKNGAHIHFKQDGKRFGTERTVKLVCDTKYDITVSVKPLRVDQLKLNKLVIGSDELTPDGCTEQRDRMDYKFVWLTTGYQPTKKAARNDVRICYKFENGELAFPIQAKFYSLSNASHSTWGSILKSIDVESTGNFQPGASPHQRYACRSTSFR